MYLDFFVNSCGAKPLIKWPKFTVIGGAGSASSCCCDGCIGVDGIGVAIGGGSGGVVICGSCGILGINPCDFACANASTGVAVVVSRHKENLPGCSFM